MNTVLTLRDVLELDMPMFVLWLDCQRACDGAFEWVRQQPSARAAWQGCHRPDWLLWLCRRCGVGLDDPRRYVRCALAAARAVESLMPDQCSRDALAVVDRWPRGEATVEELQAATAWAEAADAAKAAAAWAAAADAAKAEAAWAAAAWAAAAAAWATRAGAEVGLPMVEVCDTIREEFAAEAEQ